MKTFKEYLNENHSEFEIQEWPFPTRGQYDKGDPGSWVEDGLGEIMGDPYSRTGAFFVPNERGIKSGLKKSKWYLPPNSKGPWRPFPL